MLGYEIVFPPPAQLELRRKQLDDAGFQAWLFPIILLATIYAGRRLLVSTTVTHERVVPKAPGSLQALSRRVIWILNTTYIPEFGPLHIQLIGALYLSWLLFLVFRNTGNDYLHLSKAFGHVAVSQLPLHYLLAFKTPRSPIALATGLTHERLNAYHRLFGRIVHGLLWMHAILYIRFFVVKDLLAKRIQDRDVRLGITAFWLFNFLGLLALPPIRKKAYHRWFYRSHVVYSAFIVVILFFHVPYTRRYVLQAGVFWLANGVFRSRACEKAKVKCETVEETELVKVNVELDSAISLAGWVPGQHVYLRQGLLGPRSPFTIVEVRKLSQATSVRMMLVARNLGGPQTGLLGQRAADGKEVAVSIEGPYGEASEYLPALLEEGKSAGQIVMVAGGVGATYCLPIYLYLLKARGECTKLKMLWFVKSQTDARWGVDMLQQVSQSVDIEIYVTQESRTDSVKISATNGIRMNNTGSRPDLSTVLEPIIAPKSERVANGPLVSKVKRDPRNVKKSHGKLTVFVCGPPGLSQALKKEIGKHVMGYGREVAWFEEQFGLGGS